LRLAPCASWQGPSPLPHLCAAPWPAGGQSPGQRPPRHRRTLRPRRARRWPAVGPGPAGLLGTVPHGRGKRGSRFLVPPEEVKALSPLPWQGPSPLPLRQAGPCPAGGQSPRPAPAPPLAGASRPPGRALASTGPGPAGLQGTVARGRGKRGSRFLIPPALTTAPSSLLWQRPSPLPQSNADPCPAGGPKPPASARPALGGRFAPAGSGAGLCCAVGTGPVWKRSAQAGKRGSRFLFPSKGEIPFPGPGKSSRPAGGGEAFSAAC